MYNLFSLSLHINYTKILNSHWSSLQTKLVFTDLLYIFWRLFLSKRDSEILLFYDLVIAVVSVHCFSVGIAFDLSEFTAENTNPLGLGLASTSLPLQREYTDRRMFNLLCETMFALSLYHNRQCFIFFSRYHLWGLSGLNSSPNLLFSSHAPLGNIMNQWKRHRAQAVAHVMAAQATETHLWWCWLRW